MVLLDVSGTLHLYSGLTKVHYCKLISLSGNYFLAGNSLVQ